MAPLLRLYEDVLSNDSPMIDLPPLPRMLFVTHGGIRIGDRIYQDGEALGSEDAIELSVGHTGATLWRWELAGPEAAPGVLSANHVASREKLSAWLQTLPKGRLLLRGDAVAFPPGGCAYLHRHQGPGIRCLLEGGIRIDALDRSTSYGPGGAWYECGSDPVFAQAAADRPTRFIRTMILPVAYVGKSSAEYLNDEDKAKPKVQHYKIFADLPLSVEGR